MSERSLSPASRSHAKAAIGKFRENEEIGDDYDIDKEELSESESEELEVSIPAIPSSSKFQSPEKSITHEASPPRSPMLTQRKNVDSGRSPEVVSVTQETSRYIYEYDKYGNSVKQLIPSGSGSRRSSLTRGGVENVMTSADHNVSNDVHLETTYMKQIESKKTYIKVTDESSSFLSILGIILGLVAILVIGAFVVNMDVRGENNNPSSSKEGTPEALFAIKWMNLQKGFKNQSKRFWSIAGAATRSIVDEPEPRDPAVILLVVPKNAIASGRCFVRKYMATVNGLFKKHENDVIQFNSRSYQDIKPDRVKMMIDRELENGFKGGKKVAVVEHLESLSAEAAMMFYRFCDNDIAPFKRVAILLTLQLAEDELSEEKDAVVENKLAALWEPTLGEDKFQPLMSRIGNSIVFLRPESLEVLAENGC